MLNRAMPKLVVSSRSLRRAAFDVAHTLAQAALIEGAAGQHDA